ncbi:Uncharacterised protein [Mycobacteroides abscessus]|nr:Uncharacterised protein [Mycobacteroides abscessus]
MLQNKNNRFMYLRKSNLMNIEQVKLKDLVGDQVQM